MGDGLVQSLVYRVQDTGVWGSGVCVDDANSYSLWSVTEEVVYPVNEKWGDIEELLYHVMAMDCVKSGNALSTFFF